MRKRKIDENKLRKYTVATISKSAIVNFADALNHVYFANEAEKGDLDFLNQVMLNRGRGKQWAIYVLTLVENEQYQLIYGQKRLYAAEKLNKDVLTVYAINADAHLNMDAVNTLFLQDHASRSSYDKGRIFSDLLELTGEKFEQLAVETGLSYHTLRSIDSAYKTAQKYPSLKKAYQAEQVHQGLVNLTANYYKQLPSPDDQQTLTDYLIQTRDDGFARLKKAVQAREDIPVRDRIIGYIQSDLHAAEIGESRPEPVYAVANEDIITPLLPGDKEGASSFTPMFGISRDGILLFREIFDEVNKQKEVRAKETKSKVKKISKHVLKVFYLMCRDQLIYITADNLLMLDNLWENDRFPKFSGMFYHYFEKCYVIYTQMQHSAPYLFWQDFSEVFPFQNNLERKANIQWKSIPKLIDDITFYGLIKEYVQQLSNIPPANDQISDLAAKYCENPDRVTQAKTYFVTASRYLQAKDGLQKEIIDLLPDCYAI